MQMPERLARETIYSCAWLTLYGDRVRLPGGRIIERYHVLEFPRESAVAVVDDGDGRVLLVQSYRYVTSALQWEAPGGFMEDGETPEAAALRETVEESGHVCSEPRLVYTYHPMNGIANQVFHVVRARATGEVRGFDENEVAAWRWFTRDEVEALLARNELRDGFSLTALLFWLREEPGA